MRKLLKQETISSRQPFSSLPYRLLYLFTWATLAVALVAGVILLISDVFSTMLSHALLSAAPLLLIGTTSLGLQVLIRPKLLDLFKALIVSSAFMLWGIDQLCPLGWFATTLGDVVIVLYVIDLGWMMVDRLKQQWKSRHAKPGTSGDEGYVSSSELDERESLRLLSSPPLEEKPSRQQQIIRISRGCKPSLKPNRLAPLSCTCASPLAPFRSSSCCKEMQEVSRP